MRIFFLSLTAFLTICAFQIVPSSYPPNLEKKIKKQIVKTFEGDGLKMSRVGVDSNSFSHDVFEIQNASKKKLGYVVVTLSNSCKKGGCEVVKHEENAEYEQYYFSTIYDLDGSILNVKVLDYSSERGYEITAKRWLRQFIGKKGGTLKVNQDIDAISGATVSVNSIVKEINAQQGLLGCE